MTNSRMQFYQNVPKPSTKLEGCKLAPILYLQPYTKLDFDLNGQLIIANNNDNEEDFYGINDLAAIIAIEPVQLESTVMSVLLRAQIPVSIFSESGVCLGRLQPAFASSPSACAAQLDLSEAEKLHLVKNTIWSFIRKIRRYLLRTLPEDRRNKQLELMLQYLINEIDKQDNINSLQGFLGQATQLYYNEISYCINGAWDFDKNSNKPLNLMFDYVYNLLSEIIEINILSVGLDPNIGFWHVSYLRTPTHKHYRHQKGLVVDILNQFKIYGEAVVIKSINTGQVALKDFDDCHEGDALPPRVVKVLTKTFEQKMRARFQYPHLNFSCSYQEAIYVQVKQYYMYLLGEIDNYYCFELK